MPKDKDKPVRFNARNAARDFMPQIVESLKRVVEEGDGIACIKAASELIKLAELDTIPQEIDDAIEVQDAEPQNEKIIPIKEAV
jgi:hypothetical protein